MALHIDIHDYTKFADLVRTHGLVVEIRGELTGCLLSEAWFEYADMSSARAFAKSFVAGARGHRYYAVFRDKRTTFTADIERCQFQVDQLCWKIDRLKQTLPK